MDFNFNTADRQQAFDVLPAKTLCRVVGVIRPGGHGPGGYLTLSKNGSGFEYLNLEMTISSHPHGKRKIFQNLGTGGTTEGHQKAAKISRDTMRGILESARGLSSKDESPATQEARKASGYQDFDGLEFAVELKVEKGKDGYDDKNGIRQVLTAEHPMYQRVMNGETILPAGVENNGGGTQGDAAPFASPSQPQATQPQATQPQAAAPWQQPQAQPQTAPEQPQQPQQSAPTGTPSWAL